MYDYRAAGSALHGISPEGGVASKYALLDGLASHLATQLASFASVEKSGAAGPPSPPSLALLARMIRVEFLDGLIPVGDVNIATGRGRKSEGDAGGSLDSGEGEQGSDEEGDLARLRLDRTRLVVATCTVLHRIHHCSADGGPVPTALTLAICGYLADVCSDRIPGEPGEAIPKEGHDRSDQGEFPASQDRASPTEAPEAHIVVEVPRLADTVAANLLVLLEEIILARVQCARVRNSADRGNGGAWDRDSNQDGKTTAAAASSILTEMIEGLGVTMMMPMCTREVAKFVYNEEAKIDGAQEGEESTVLLDVGAKLIVRMGLLDIADKLSRHASYIIR